VSVATGHDTLQRERSSSPNHRRSPGDADGDLSEDSDDDQVGVVDERRRLEAHRPSPPTRASPIATQWQVFVQVVKARDLPVLGNFDPSVVCCMSILHLGGTKTDISSHYTVDHDHGVGKDTRDAANRQYYCSIQPHHITKAATAGTSPSWNLRDSGGMFLFKDAYPPVKDLENASSSGKLHISGDVRAPLDGSDVMLIVTLHDALGWGKTEFLAKALLPVKVGYPADHWVVLRARDGGHVVGKEGRSPAVLLRVGYGVASLDDAGKFLLA
jgi:hypothetical protein